MTGFVYILKSLKNDTFYIGSTINLKQRLIEHQNGRSKYTSEILPVELVFSQKYPTLQIARKIEYWLKRQKDRDFIFRIINDGKINKIIS